ncbi:hypothetical protein MPQ_1511 [Methylovorus sp. MP688]|nr:hypothetical protein MPQ_1511 [Methylovorus sp. MP688]
MIGAFFLPLLPSLPYGGRVSMMICHSPVGQENGCWHPCIDYNESRSIAYSFC